MILLLLVFGPLLVGLCCLLLQRGFRLAPMLTYVISLGISVYVLTSDAVLQVHLVDSYGIALLLDKTASWFILLNALVSIAVAWHERYRSRHHYFFILLALLHGCVNACFISKDLFNLYVVIELTTIIAFLLISQGMTTRHLWNALRYIFLSNVGMLFFLLGALLVYEVNGDFSYAGVVDAPPTARALIITGLLVKGGVFIPGLWLPQAHSEADAAVSALLSGVVVNIGLLPLLRLEAYSPDIELILRVVGFGGIFTGLGLAFFQRDIKRLLACSTISQVSFVLISPVAGPMYAFAHGVAKATLFLCAGSLPERDLSKLHQKKVGWPLAWPMMVAALSIAGCPLLVGFTAKYAVGEMLAGWQKWAMLLASVGTAVILTPIILMPQRRASWTESPAWQAPVFLCAALLLAGLLTGTFGAVEAWIKSVGVLCVGFLFYRILFRKLMHISLPSGWEKLEHIVGMICIATLVLILGVYL